MESTGLMLFGNEALKAKPFADIQNMFAKNSPEILVGAGVAGVLVSTVLACHATLKAPMAAASAKAKFAEVADARAMSLNPETADKIDYNDAAYYKDLTVASLQTAVDFGKLYGLPAVLMGASLFAIFKGHGITMKRNAGLTAAVSAVTAGYNGYRARVKEKLGNEAEQDLYYDRKTEVIESTDAKGKVTKKKVSIVNLDPEHSVYAKFFDEGSAQWQPSPELNLTFLRCQQNYANDKLRINKVLFLNEVYDMLGLPRTKEGALVGWAITLDGDNYVDFGLYDNETFAKRRFINGEEVSVLLDFNVDGLVYDLL